MNKPVTGVRSLEPPSAGHADSQSSGAEVVLARRFSFVAVIGVSYAILNSWVAMSASLNVVLPSGGPVAMLYGLIVSTIGALALAASLAEMCHVYPTSGGPYHWSAKFAPEGYEPIISWICGWWACAGWWALTATASSLAGQLITGIIALLHPNYVLERWHIFLIYIAFAIGAWVINTFAVRLLDPLNKAALFWSLFGATIIAITCLACASPNYQPGSFVFGQLINSTGWPDGVAWILGLLQSAFGLIGYDGCTHLVEEMENPHLTAPRAMILAVLIGASSSFIFLIVLLFCLTDIAAASTSEAGALLEIIYQAIGNKAGSVVLLMFPVVSMAFAALGILTGASRMTHAFARDGGLPFSHVLARVSERWNVPVASLTLTSVLVVIFGCIYLGSTSALNAILSSSVVALNISYSIPIVLVLVRGRHLLRPADQPAPTLTLGKFGPIVNIVGLLFALFTSIFFLFPPDLPVDASSMNYTVVVFGVVAIVSTGTWFLQGKKHFRGPLDMELLLQKAYLARTDLPANNGLADEAAGEALDSEGPIDEKK